ncbi:hypothetical protein C8R48DRAFT_712854 [Suillus tomentosus]|nr:hypothetical protein C8R48DRAFT_712854 [Suillus tomentosus]
MYASYLLPFLVGPDGIIRTRAQVLAILASVVFSLLWITFWKPIRAPLLLRVHRAAQGILLTSMLMSPALDRNY